MSPLDKAQAMKIVKVTAYVAVSAALDYLISISMGTQFGPLTPLINILLVSVRQLFKRPS